MTPYEIDCAAKRAAGLRERRDQEQSEIATEWYSDGQADAGLGQLPRWTDEAYLAGYVSRLNQLPKNPDGTIQHYTPRKHFAFGFMDSPDDCTCDEF